MCIILVHKGMFWKVFVGNYVICIFWCNSVFNWSIFKFCKGLVFFAKSLVIRILIYVFDNSRIFHIWGQRYGRRKPDCARGKPSTICRLLKSLSITAGRRIWSKDHGLAKTMVWTAFMIRWYFVLVGTSEVQPDTQSLTITSCKAVDTCVHGTVITNKFQTWLF